MRKIRIFLESCGVLFGLVLATAAYSECQSAADIGKNGGMAIGTVTAVETERNENGDFFRPVVQFEDAHQVTHSFKGKYTEVRPVVGLHLRVAYSVADPSFSALADEGYEGFVGGRVIGAVIAIVVFGVSLLVSVSDQCDRKRADGSEPGP